MRNVTLQQYHVCTNNSQAHIKVNCKYWSVKEENCLPFCSLKNINCSLPDCKRCDKRDPIIDSQKNKNDSTHPFIKQMREKLPQHNAFKVTESKIVDKSFTEKAMTYGAAEASQLIQGKVSEEIFEKRKAICMACPYRVNESKHGNDSIGWCKGGCGCSVGNPRAALSQKLYMPTLSCPKNKFGPEKGEGFNVSDAADSVKGIITSVKNLFEKDK